MLHVPTDALLSMFSSSFLLCLLMRAIWIYVRHCDRLVRIRAKDYFIILLTHNAVETV